MRDLFKLLGYLVHIASSRSHPRWRLAVVVLAGLISGGGNIVLIAIVNSFVQGSSAPAYRQSISFGLLCMAVAASRFFSQYLLASMASHAVLNLRMKLCRQVFLTPLRKLEEIGPARLMAHLTEDISALSEAVAQIPVIVVNASIVLAALAYLGWLSLQLLVFILVCMTVGIAMYQAPVSRSMSLFRQSRENWDGLFTGFQGVTRGIKELQLNRGRQTAFYNEVLLHLAKIIQQFGLRGYTVLAAANSWGQILFFVVLGAVLFAAPLFHSVEHRIASGYALTLLFLIGPVEAVLNAFPAIARARSSAGKLDAVGLVLGGDQELPAVPVKHGQRWSSILLRNVTHTYFSEDREKGFTVGPVDLRIEPGEIIFLVGGNGSGKTTLAKLIVGLYEPELGSILLDGQRVTDFSDYRQMFSAVFSDFYLFDSLSGVAEGDLQDKAREYLRVLGLKEKVAIEAGRLSTLDLSQGQRKRLALLTAWIEDRPVYLFDEWSADQDILYREFFYRQVLPGLREQSKAVIVISHDERYYDVADRIVELDYGQIQTQRTMRKGAWA